MKPVISSTTFRPTKEPIEMVGCKRVEVIIADNKLWVNADGICKFRAAWVGDVVIFDKRTNKIGAKV